MTAAEIATITTGSIVSYEDIANPVRLGELVGTQETAWGTQYGVRFNGRIHVTDLRQAGWKIVAA